MSAIAGDGVPSVVGMSLQSSLAHVDCYCLFRISALSFAHALSVPFSFKGAIPLVSLHRDLINEPVHEISNNVVCATSKASDQPAHTRSLIRAFDSRLSILRLLSYWLNSIWSFQA